MEATHQLTINEDDECGFCLQPAKDMETPRALSCGHIFCTPCIKENLNPLMSEVTCIFKTCG